ncbi:MAG: response regulator transcription factor [Eubacterium sp.]|nr:response regulator transcription factor [Eubacterium sp.]MBR6171806.1 response regulator transcription factor [Eubacterium sp.]
MERILIVEDDKGLLRLFQTVLKKEGYEVSCAEDGLQALRFLERDYADLIISDLMMPNLDGFQLIEAVRKAGRQTPILVITAKEGFDDMRRGFALGLDDYMVKPVNVNELILRVRALLRRNQMLHERKQAFGSLIMDMDTMTVTIGEDSQVLPQKEFMLLYKLISTAGKTFTRQQLMDEVWGSDSPSDVRTVDVHINRLRERFRDFPEMEITTVRGLGYKIIRKSGT